MSKWSQDHITDPYYKLKKKHNVISRAYFKIKELNEKFNFLKNKNTVLDLGAAPGGWCQYFLEKKIKCLAVDQNPVVIDVDFLQADINNLVIKDKFDVITADLSHKLTGIKTQDQNISFLLNLKVIDIVNTNLNTNGNLITKIFNSEEVSVITNKLSHLFKMVKITKPKASKDKSSEIYIIAMDFKY